MEPPKPDRRAQILKSAPNVNAAEYEEYERLLAMHFTKDPSKRKDSLTAMPDPDELRLEELRRKLFNKP
jgi:hypothetical protein